ncbi:MAG: hypothetical protein NZ805_08960 [Armatimonadetes bacterium]|nr:hypothetical protein [Armatimonadota bacterium]MDW8029039.1 hypothetical protein [Armatimonadota bacterium]
MSLKGKKFSIKFAAFLLLAIFAAFIMTLSVYGDSWLVPWHDEVVIVRLAQNLAEGKGFRNDLIGDLLFGADEKTYWQMPLYPFALSLWVKIFGFDLNSVRAFSRIVGLFSLLLLTLLCRNLNLPFGATSLAVLWTASDLTFQFASNFARPDALTGCLLLLTAVLLSTRLHESVFGSALIGLVLALAVFNHPIALPCWFVGFAIVVKRSSWRNGLAFCFPMAIFFSLWLWYVIGGWEIFIAQMKAHFSHKQYSLTDTLVFLLGSTAWGIEFYLGIPLNAMLWFVPVAITAYTALREKWLVPRWLFTFAFVLYVVAMAGAEAWYPSLFVPFGYLMLASFFDHLLRKTGSKFGRLFIATLALLWWSYQVSVVARHLSAVPKIRLQVSNFVSELESLLPPKAKVFIGSFSPDPTFALMVKRPDVKVYALMPSRMINADALKRLRNQLTHLLVLKEATVVEPLLGGDEIRRWKFDFGGLSRDNVTEVVLLSAKGGATQ